MTPREFQPEDNIAWHRIVGHPGVAPHAPWPVIATPDAASAWINETRRLAAMTPRRGFYLAMEQYGTDDLVGCGTLDVLSLPHRQAEIACYLRPDRWREGLGTEIARLLLEIAFTRLGLHRVQASVDPENIAARRVLEHINMRHEGTSLDRYFLDGKWCDRALYAITLPEWRGQPRRGTGEAGLQQEVEPELESEPELAPAPALDVETEAHEIEAESEPEREPENEHQASTSDDPVASDPVASA